MLRQLIVIALLITLPTTSLAQFSQNPNDEDGDGLLNSEEDVNGDGIVNTGETDPYDADTDGGGEADGSEIQNGRNPLDRTDDMTYDLDNDGLTNGQEDIIGTDRAKADTDGDGINDKDDPFPCKSNTLKTVIAMASPMSMKFNKIWSVINAVMPKKITTTTD